MSSAGRSLLLCFCVYALFCVAPASSVVWPCGWPLLSEYSNRPASLQTQLLQYLLEATGEHVTADGLYGSETKAAVASFQSRHHLSADGVAGQQTWQVVLSLFTPLSAGAQGSAVTGLQRALEGYGVLISVSGTYDTQTETAVAKFQSTRGANTTTGHMVDGDTWHLLVSGCNSSSATAAFWADLGWPQGSVSTATMKCLRAAGFQFLTFECWREFSGWFGTCVDNIKNAWSAGFQSVGVYMFPIRGADPSLQAAQLVSNLSAAGVKYTNVMLDIEGNDWVSDGRTQQSNREFITSLRDALEKLNVKVLIYCGENWNTYFGDDFNTFKDLPLVYAHYDNIPGFYDSTDAATHYGGWTKPSGKQFWDGSHGETMCGMGAVDWDWSDKPFW